MGLLAKQVVFSRCQAEFQHWCFENGIEFVEAESFRTKEQAQIYAKQGKGILNSVHRLKLARDLYRVKNGTVTWRREDYEEMGEKWKSLHPLARWGGDFKGRDSVHFSFEHNGIR